jgi:TPR repeat protein
MEALARGQGEVPAIVLRSGKASVSNAPAIQATYAWYVGLAYLRGAVAPKDAAVASMWFERGARQGFSPAQVMWARALRDGNGVTPDPVAAHGWFTLAATQGNGIARSELARLEAGLSAEQLEQARSRGTPLGTP